jgi:hypothetical protein
MTSSIKLAFETSCAVLLTWSVAAWGPSAPASSDARSGDATTPPIGDASAPPDTSSPDVDAAPLPPQTARLRIVSRCAEPIWIAHSDNVPFDQNVKLEPDEFHDYDIPAGGLASARFWPKLGCDATGHGCRIGDTGEGGGAPCAPGGCQPPLDSKFEVSFAPTTSAEATFYNLSLVDGYTLPFSVTPVGTGAGVGSCTVSDCSMLSLADCPAHEDLGGDGVFPAFGDVDLRVHDPVDPTEIIGCLSPCKAWQYPAPYGLGHPESQDPGLHMCCPTPIDPGTGQCTEANGCITPDECRAASDPLSVVHTQFVDVVHAGCPTAYSYSYDDAAGLHACPASTGFEVVFCR